LSGRSGTSVASSCTDGAAYAEPELEAGRYVLLGTTVHAITREGLVEQVVRDIGQGKRKCIYGNHNLHSLQLCRTTPALQAFYAKCRLAHIDGMSLVLLGRVLGLPLRREHRTTYLDWIELFLATAEQHRWKIYVLGGPEEHAAKLPSVLAAKYPSLEVRAHHGFVTKGDDGAVWREIADFAPQVMMVGMGMPRQEEWILRALPHLSVNAIFNCGAAFEYIAGNKYRPPRWAGQLGLEWLFRMASEPRRLASRYLVEPFQLLPMLAAAAWHSAWQGRSASTHG
jgi:N-acetylglucosaminyldiphosphoundecaprenol N-acetyl-beta-D-mannosaminyltransferase